MKNLNFVAGMTQRFVSAKRLIRYEKYLMSLLGETKRRVIPAKKFKFFTSYRYSYDYDYDDDDDDDDDDYYYWEFMDSLCLRCNLPLPNLSSYCTCEEMFIMSTMLCHARREVL